MELRVETLPFEERDPLDLLGIVRGRATPDLDYAGYGYARVGEVELASEEGDSVIVRDALVIALHTPDEPDEDEALEVELEIVVGGEELSVLVPLESFLDRRAAGIVDGAREVVLALCNPRGLEPRRPVWLTGKNRLYWATGDVIAWLDLFEEGRERIRLQARAWHTIR